jgi:hypothetical protein
VPGEIRLQRSWNQRYSPPSTHDVTRFLRSASNAWLASRLFELTLKQLPKACDQPNVDDDAPAHKPADDPTTACDSS